MSDEQIYCWTGLVHIFHICHLLKGGYLINKLRLLVDFHSNAEVQEQFFGALQIYYSWHDLQINPKSVSVAIGNFREIP